MQVHSRNRKTNYLKPYWKWKLLESDAEQGFGTVDGDFWWTKYQKNLQKQVRSLLLNAPMEDDRPSLKVLEREREITELYLAANERDTEADAMEDSNGRSNIFIGLPPVADAVQIRRSNPHSTPASPLQLPPPFWPVGGAAGFCTLLGSGYFTIRVLFFKILFTEMGSDGREDIRWLAAFLAHFGTLDLVFFLFLFLFFISKFENKCTVSVLISTLFSSFNLPDLGFFSFFQVQDVDKIFKLS